MNWLLKLLGYHEREYHGDGFSVRIEPIGREVMSVIYQRQASILNLVAGWVGRNGTAIGIEIPQELKAERTSQLVGDLETALTALRYGYMITAKGITLAKSQEL